MSLLGTTQNPSVAPLTDTTTQIRTIVSLTGTALNLNDGVYRPVASLTGTALDLNEGSKAHALLDGATLNLNYSVCSLPIACQSSK